MVKKLFSVIIGTSLAASLLFVATSLVKPAKAGGAVELTSYKDVEAKMGGKNGFVKFFAPW